MTIDIEKARASYRKLPHGAAFTPIAIVQDELLRETQHYINARRGGYDVLAVRSLSAIYSLCRVKRQMVQAA